MRSLPRVALTRLASSTFFAFGYTVRVIVTRASPSAPPPPPRPLPCSQVLDDSAVSDAGIDGGDEGGGEGEDDGQDVGGFYFGTMLKRRPELQEKLKVLKDEVLNRHHPSHPLSCLRIADATHWAPVLV